LQRLPEITDCNIKHLKAFESFHGRDEAITVLLSSQITFSLKGPLVGESLILPPNSRQGHDINWFKESMDRIVLRPGVFSYYSNDMYASISQVTNCDDSSDGDMPFGNDHEDERNEEETDKKVKEPFQSLLPTMSGICNLIERESDLAIVKKYMNIAHNELLQKRSAKVQTGTNINSTVSFPAIDTRKNDTRKRPASSPGKRRSNRK
jgi:hypothetical protein